MAADALHLTLVFLGSRPAREIPRIISEAFEAAAGLPAPRLTPAGVKPVPPRRPRLFALGLEDSGGAAAAIQAAVSAALSRGGYHEPEKRPFWPHITLARVRKGQRAEPLPNADTGIAAAPGSGADPFTARELTLYRSTLHPKGARYEPLERLTLPGSAPSTDVTDIDPAIGGQM